MAIFTSKYLASLATQKGLLSGFFIWQCFPSTLEIYSKNVL